MRVVISAQLVKELRDKTDAGIMECKNALKECNGNIEESIEFLRKKGLSKAAKKVGRVAAEGVIAMKISDDRKKATMIEFNSETDFVAKNENFKGLVDIVLNVCYQESVNDVQQLESMTIDGMGFQDYLKSYIAKIGENIVLRRARSVECKGNEILNGYVHHNGKVGSICVLGFKDERNAEAVSKLARDLSIHIASMKPKVLSFDSFTLDFVNREKEAIKAELAKENEELSRLGKRLHKIPEYISRMEIDDKVIESKRADLQNELRLQGKPEKIWDRIIPGQIERFIADNSILDQRLTLLYQTYAMDDSKNVYQAIEEKNAALKEEMSVERFLCFELGEGIEKRVDDFAKEVAAQMQG